jgi:hypothetical protein
MNDRRLYRVLGEAIELLDRSHPVLLARLADMTEAMNGHPKSGALDRVGSPAKTTFCEIHSRERCPCGQGTPFANLSDPAGDAAVARAMGGDRAATARRELEQRVESIARQAEEIVRTLAAWTPRAPTDSERAETLSVLNDRDVSCWSCARVKDSAGRPRWEPARCAIEVTPGVRRELCRWCQDWFRQTGQLPTMDELRQHHYGKQVRRPA